MGSRRNDQPILQLVKGGPQSWANGKECAVSIAYVGGLPDHADLALPLLTDLGIPATFYVDPSEILKYAIGWNRFDTSLHELGIAPYETAHKDGSLPNWKQETIESELKDANRFVRDFFGINSIGLSVKGDGNAAEYKAINTVGHILTNREGVNTLDANVLSLSSIPSSKCPNFAKANGYERPNWTIIVFRQIFGRSNTALLTHRLILESLRRHSSDLWLAPVSEVVQQLRMR